MHLNPGPHPGPSRHRKVVEVSPNIEPGALAGARTAVRVLSETQDSPHPPFWGPAGAQNQNLELGRPPQSMPRSSPGAAPPTPLFRLTPLTLHSRPFTSPLASPALHLSASVLHCELRVCTIILDRSARNSSLGMRPLGQSIPTLAFQSDWLPQTPTGPFYVSPVVQLRHLLTVGITVVCHRTVFRTVGPSMA